jgi:GxxExxY protein
MVKISLASRLLLVLAMSTVQRNADSGVVIAAAIEVHRHMGPGLLEGVYHQCLWHEMVARGLHVEREVAIPVLFKGERIECGFRLDFLIGGQLIVEVKSLERTAPVHTAQVLTYLKLSGARQALLINFGCPTLKAGLQSFLAPGELASQS